jgi:xylulokinase
LYFSGAAVQTGAALTKWFRDVLAEEELRVEVETGQNAYQLLEQLAAAIQPGCEGLIALPFFSGEKSQISPHLNQGAFIGLTTEHTRGHIYRALLEGIAYELRYQLAAEDEIPKEMNAIGGGSLNHVWTQIISDVLQTTQYVLDNPFGAALGDAYLAGMAVGLFKDTDPLLKDWICVQRTVQPHSPMQAAYLEQYEVYLRARELVV